VAWQRNGGNMRSGEVTAVRESEQALRAILDAAPIGMAAARPNGRLERVNKALCELLGYSEEELLRMKLSDVTHPDDIAASVAGHELVRAGEFAAGQFEKRYLRRDGRTVWARVSFAAVSEAGRAPRYFIAQIQDITAERAAAEAHARLAAVVECSFDAIITATLDATIRTWNAGAERIYGYSAEEAIGANAAILAPPVERDHPARVVARIIRGEIVDPFETILRRKDGTLIDMSVTASPVRDADGVVVGISTVSRDITGRKRAEQELARSRDLLQQAEAIAQIGSWEWDLATDRVTWSAGVYNIFKLTPEQVGATGDAWSTIEFGLEQGVHPEDRELMREALDRTISQLTRVSVQLRAIRADGRVRLLDWQADPIVDQSGRPVRVIGVVRDITGTRRADEALEAAPSDLFRHTEKLQQLTSAHPGAGVTAAAAALTPRQQEVLGFVAQGLTNGEIAKRLFVSEGTVKFHVKQILLKTNSTNRTEAVVRILGTDAAKLRALPS
jgi:PAS domain S-box-containing protein